jgi:hypothetical protein
MKNRRRKQRMIDLGPLLLGNGLFFIVQMTFIGRNGKQEKQKVFLVFRGRRGSVNTLRVCSFSLLSLFNLFNSFSSCNRMFTLRYALLTKAPCAFSHAGQLCGLPDLAATCPDCEQDGTGCFFSENDEEGTCTGFSRLITLSIRSQFDGGQRHLEPQLRKLSIF